MSHAFKQFRQLAEHSQASRKYMAVSADHSWYKTIHWQFEVLLRSPYNLFFLPCFSSSLLSFTLEVHEQREAKNKLWDSVSFHLRLILFALQYLLQTLPTAIWCLWRKMLHFSSFTKFCLICPENTNEVLAIWHWPFYPIFVQQTVHPWCSGAS